MTIISHAIYHNDLLPDQIERFLKYVSIKEEGCWLWTGGKDKYGYGVFRLSMSRVVKAHKMGFVVFTGNNWPNNLVGRHECNTPLCVRPDHCVPGTMRQNSDDLIRRRHQSSLATETR